MTLFAWIRLFGFVWRLRRLSSSRPPQPTAHGKIHDLEGSIVAGEGTGGGLRESWTTGVGKRRVVVASVESGRVTARDAILVLIGPADAKCFVGST